MFHSQMGYLFSQRQMIKISPIFVPIIFLLSFRKQEKYIKHCHIILYSNVKKKRRADNGYKYPVPSVPRAVATRHIPRGLGMTEF